MRKTVFLTLLSAAVVAAFPEQGIWHLSTSKENEYVGVKKSMFKGGKINIKVRCKPTNRPLDIEITWMLRKTPCWNEYVIPEDGKDTVLKNYFNHPGQFVLESKDGKVYEPGFVKTEPERFPCDDNIILDEVDLETKLVMKSDADAKEAHVAAARAVAGDTAPTENAPVTKSGVSANDISAGGAAQTKHPVAILPFDGVYLLVVHTAVADDVLGNDSYIAEIDIEMRSDYGYLSAVDWPLLGFYVAMCVVYLIYGLAWLIVSFMHWRELLRVQYWIGTVILLGMLEKAVFTAEYSSINQNGYSVPGLIILAELASCAKRTLARMLVIIVSLGFGIVKPRLGVILHRVVGVGLLYFVLSSIEGCTRALQSRSDPQKQVLLASLPLSLLESAICLWIFTGLVQTTRILRLRRNLVKLSLYRHFTNTLAFAVIASVIFMVWSIRYHQFEKCLTDWKELWVDDAYWHVLFAVVLLVIMILWRPSNNNQRFAFSPLLDDGSDADDEEEAEKLMADISDTMKFRNTRNSTSSSPRESRSVEDDLKWVEENIPSSIADSALPILDSDEEIVTSKFEISKMQ
ncbi:transmembrane protein 87A-like [Penaeus japonicus]|uniref:transmembrane protein 87A-like n=1 Tax=Penaeus japonicus TaxID=27405 RepID=UPI001C7173F8|nr:transmembrane protein 87A-like [Penaeus japonicus]